MNLNIEGIFDKIRDKAFLVTVGASGWEAIPSHHDWAEKGKSIMGKLQYMLDPNTGALNELKNTLTWPGLIEEKMNSNHIYAAGLKYSALVWLIGEATGFLGQYKKTAEEVFKGSLLSLAIFPGSGEHLNPADTKIGRRGAELSNPSSITLENAGAY
jgi:hypothetical protein